MNLELVNPFLLETNVFHNHSNYIFGNQSRLIFVFGVLVFYRTWPFIANWPELLGTCMVNPKTLSIIWLLIILLPITKWPEIDDQSSTDTKCMWNGGFVENCNQVFTQVGTRWSSTPSTMILRNSHHNKHM